MTTRPDDHDPADLPPRLGERMRRRWPGMGHPVGERPEPMATGDERDVDEFTARRTEAAEEAKQRRDDRWTEIARPKFSDVRWSDVHHPPAVLNQLHAWLEDAKQGRPANLILTGDNGVGKTYAALALLKELHYADMSVAFMPTVELLDQLRPPESAPTKPFVALDVLALDDLGAEKVTDWTVERFYVVVNGRWLDRKPTIVTTNLKPAAIKEAIGPRSYDRLADDAVAIDIAGDSRRRRRPNGES